MKAEILTIGDEILRGEIVDSNKAFLSERLLDYDVDCCFQTSVKDVPEDGAAVSATTGVRPTLSTVPV